VIPAIPACPVRSEGTDSIEIVFFKNRPPIAPALEKRIHEALAMEPGGGNAIMLGLCGGIEDPTPGDSVSRHHSWNAYNCGYQAYRQGKVFGANP